MWWLHLFCRAAEQRGAPAQKVRLLSNPPLVAEAAPGVELSAEVPEEDPQGGEVISNHIPEPGKHMLHKQSIAHEGAHLCCMILERGSTQALCPNAGAPPAWGQLGGLCCSLWRAVAPPLAKRHLPLWTFIHACICLYLFAYMAGGAPHARGPPINSLQNTPKCSRYLLGWWHQPTLTRAVFTGTSWSFSGLVA